MNGKQTSSVVALVIGVAIFTASLTAFSHQGGTQAVSAGGDINLSQIGNLLGMLLGGGAALTGGGLLAWIKGKLPEQAGPLIDGLAGRLQRGQNIDGPLIAAVAGLQALREYFAGTPDAGPHLDALATLAWSVDSERANKQQPNRKAVA